MAVSQDRGAEEAEVEVNSTLSVPPVVSCEAIMPRLSRDNTWGLGFNVR